MFSEFFVLFLFFNMFFSITIRAQLQIISSAEVYLAGRRRAPHIYTPYVVPPTAAAGPPTPTKEGVCLLITFMVINIHKEFFSNSL